MALSEVWSTNMTRIPILTVIAASSAASYVGNFEASFKPRVGVSDTRSRLFRAFLHRGNKELHNPLRVSGSCTIISRARFALLFLRPSKAIFRLRRPFSNIFAALAIFFS